MKKILLLIILCAGLLNALYAQPPTQNREAVMISSIFGYPLNLDNTTVDGKQITANRLTPMDVELDAMAHFQIGAIPNQTVWHEGDITVGFYVLTDTLHANNVTLSYSVDFPPAGKITCNEQTGRFKYFPDKFDTRPFTVTFRAEADGNAIVQDVLFTLMPATPPEYAAFGVEPKPLPESTNDYTIIAQTVQRRVQFNNTLKDTVCSFSITGKELVFDNQIQNTLRYLIGRSDIYELNLFAEKVIIREALHFPQANLTIYAKELVFEDSNEKEKASINTSPVMIDKFTNSNAQNGANAGSITLYIQNYRQSAPAKRFISIGGKGQNVYWDTEHSTRTPGNGGNGGVITSTIDVSEFCDVVHGSAGIQLDNKDQIQGAGRHGNDGSFSFYEKEFTWLHPNFISAVVKHAKDAYLNIYNGYTYNIFSEYTQSIADLKASDEWNELSNEAKMELNNSDAEMQALIYRIGQNLDYFGNPIGWVPMLSFEINKMAFEQEIEKAIRVMYLSYWLKHIDRNNEQYINACNEAIKLIKQDLTDNKELINQLVRLIPELQDEATALEQQIEELVIKIEVKTQQLLAQAKDNVKKQNRWNKISGVLSAVAKVAPLVCSIIPGVGTAVGMGISTAVTAGNTALSMATNASDTYGYANAIGGFFDVAGGFFQSGGFSNITNALSQIDISSLGSTAQTIQNAYETINGTVGPLITSIEKLHKVFAQSSTPNDQVQAELNKLKAESKEYQALIAESEVLNTKKEQLMQKLANTFDNIATTSITIQNNVVAIDGLGRDVFNNNSKRDLRAKQYLDDMERRAKERLLKYHYYMGKAYEYRLLKPYTAELNLSSIVERFTAIAEANPQKPILDAADFQNLKAVYEEQLSTVTADILDEYNTNRPELSIPVRFSLTQNDLDALNSDVDINLNIFERGMIPPYEENVRIVKFKIHDIKAHLEGSQSSFAYFDLLLEHSGRSKMRKDGQIYWFDHINNQNQNPVIWGIRYDANNGIVNTKEPSFASQSLLYSLLDKLGQTNDIMIYSRPGAWADIRISKNNVVSGNTKMIIDELTFELQYDFVQRPTNNRNLDIYAGDVAKSNISLSPYIEVSKADKSGRSNGRGTMYRTYNRGTSVNLEAPEEYGRWKFVHWTNRYDEVVSTNKIVTANMNNDTYLTANYQYMGPILNLTDTIKVGKSDKVATVKVENKGSEEMEWSARSNTSWVKIIAGEEGIDTDYITLEIEANTSGKKRTGSITVTAPETEEYAKNVIILQSNEDTNGMDQVKVSEGVRIVYLPGTDNYSVLLDESARNIRLDVYSINGQLVLKNYFYNTSGFGFDLSHCNQGVYIVKVNYDGERFVQKVVK
ncbi:MAG: T9SS type A sorting domain-containing protein [Dysgonamonadaceae bacterium]|jgi:hypothetical protein|nr:T9SS type A sorting domain-containing protein [Dysgonamonadaceae bacterium]